MPPTKRIASSKSAPIAPAPLVNTVLLTAALAYGLWLLVARGRLSWPPTDLLANAYTLAGCLALVGPIVLSRREGGEEGLGDLIWMAAGLLIWVFDLEALLQHGMRALASWATPLEIRPMGLTVLAILLAGWRARGGSWSWSWTNVVGWLLGLFWVGMALGSFAPARPFGLAVR
ncbi:MAG: hypothetical protein IRY99_06295 [Isosphaeraceae bacterium]|nr:hypothetical protein [Isosphaeraceae bacterium]